MGDFEKTPGKKEPSKDLLTFAIEQGTKKDGAVVVTNEDGKEKRLFDRYGGELVEIDDNSTKWKIDPETGEAIVVEYGDLSEN